MADSFVADAKTDSFTPDAPKAPEKYGPAREQSPPGRYGMDALYDTLGLGRKGAVPLTGDASTKTPLGVILKPKDATEMAVREMVLAPISAGSMPVRIGAQAGIGALDALASGQGLSGAGYEAALDALAAAFTEGLMGAAGKTASGIAKVASKVSAPRRAFEWATAAPKQALDALRARLPSGRWMNVPSISGAKMTADEAIEELVKLTGAEYQQARAEIANELSRLDKQRMTGPKPVAGTIFNQRTSPERFIPKDFNAARAANADRVASGASRVAEGLAAPATRAAADVAASTPLSDDGFPVGAIPPLKAVEGAGSLWDLARRVYHFLP